MGTCQKCGDHFPRKIIYNGREVLLVHRKYCLKCSPIGERRIWGGKETWKARLGSGVVYKRKIIEPISHICKTCGKEFKVKSRNTECTTCSSKRIRGERKDRAIKDLGGKCLVCGYTKCKRAMVFHHKVIDEKEMGLSNNWGLSRLKIENELKKCILVCNRCHEEIHDGLIKI